jgi:rhamnosyltransferase
MRESPAAGPVTVAIPVRDGGEALARTLAALARQSVDHELLVCDSGSRDRSRELARAHGARVLEIAPERFNHGAARNLLVREAAGRHVALLSQDAEPLHERWLEQLLAAFALADDVAIAYGPYRARPEASLAVRLELERWFRSLAPDGSPQIERLGEHERNSPALELLGPRGFFTDANSCVAREAWERVPFREVSYAEDRALAIDMLRAGYAKAYIPAAAVLHSHELSAVAQVRRAFDEWRALREVYGWREPATPAHLASRLRGELAYASRELARAGVAPARRIAPLAGVGLHHSLRLTGALLGSRGARMPRWARAVLSLERRANFAAIQPDRRRAGGERGRRA